MECIELKWLCIYMKKTRSSRACTELSKTVFSCECRWRCTLRSKTFSGNLKLFKNDEKCFLFQLKSSFRFQDILIFVFNFSSCKKRLDQKHMANFKVCDITTWLTKNYNTHTSKGDEKMKLAQLIEYNMRTIFFKNYTQNVEEELLPNGTIIIIEHISRSIVLFLLYAKLRDIKIYWN